MTINCEIPSGYPFSSSTNSQPSEALYTHLNKELNNIYGKTSLQDRFRSLFTLKNLATDRAVEIVCSCFKDPSVLLKHELAYVLGQMKNVTALPTLMNILEDDQEDPMVRHEAGEALGAIGAVEAIPILQKYLNHSNSVISETCTLALDRIEAYHDPNHPDYSTLHEGPQPHLAFYSVDPAPAENSTKSISSLEKDLLDTTLPLYARYKAMFALRNIGGPVAVHALTKGFSDPSPLFRHEIAFVLGQLQHPSSLSSLALALSDKSEVAMVRHECAEAIGALADASKEANQILSQYIHDKEDVVRESCLIALDILDYETDPNAFQYAVTEKDLPIKKMKEGPTIQF